MSNQGLALVDSDPSQTLCNIRGAVAMLMSLDVKGVIHGSEVGINNQFYSILSAIEDLAENHPFKPVAIEGE